MAAETSGSVVPEVAPTNQYGILGPLEVHADGRPVRLTAFKQRALLAVLLIDANRTVPVERLVECIWRDRPPDDAGAALQVLVAQLRRALEPGRRPNAPSYVLLTRPGGYELRMEPGQVDAARFETLSAQGRDALARGDPAGARARLDAGLALWRGAAFADFPDDPFAQAERARLEEERLAAVTDVNDARLRLGDHAALVGDLRALVVRHPLQERFRAQLMLALYRCGRQAEALEAYLQTPAPDDGRRARHRAEPQPPTPAGRDPRPRPEPRAPVRRRPRSGRDDVTAAPAGSRRGIGGRRPS